MNKTQELQDKLATTQAELEAHYTELAAKNRDHIRALFKPLVDLPIGFKQVTINIDKDGVNVYTDHDFLNPALSVEGEITPKAENFKDTMADLINKTIASKVAELMEAKSKRVKDLDLGGVVLKFKDIPEADWGYYQHRILEFCEGKPAEEVYRLMLRLFVEGLTYEEIDQFSYECPVLAAKIFLHITDSYSREDKLQRLTNHEL